MFTSSTKGLPVKNEPLPYVLEMTADEAETLLLICAAIDGIPAVKHIGNALADLHPWPRAFEHTQLRKDILSACQAATLCI